MSSLPQQKHITTLLALLIAGVILLGVLAILQNQEIKRLASEPADTVQQAEEQDVPVGSGDIVAKKTIQGPGFLFDVIHYCDGTIMTNVSSGVEPAQFCIGDNALVFKDGTREKTIATHQIERPEFAPVLIDVALVPTETGERRLLISYETDVCRTMGDCGAGMPSNYVSHVFATEDLTARTLVNYPQTGDGIWNQSGTKALFALETCGGAGCVADQLFAYNVDEDIVKPVTTEKAARSAFESAPQTIDGAKLPYWGDIKWTTDSKFSATIVNVNGTKKVINGAF